MSSIKDAVSFPGNVTLTSNSSEDPSNGFGFFHPNSVISNPSLTVCPELSEAFVELYLSVAPIISVAFLFTSAAFGIPGNVLILILASKAPRAASLPYIIFLAIFDLLTLLIALALNIWSTFEDFEKLLEFSFLDTFVNAPKVINNWILALLALERCVAVCFPLKKRLYFTVKTAYLSALCVIIFSFGVYLPYYNIERVKKLAFYPVTITLWILPGLVMLVCTSLVVWQLRKVQRQRQDQVTPETRIRLSQRESDFTRLMVLTCVFYFVFHFPLLFSVAFFGDSSDFSKWKCISDDILIETLIYMFTVQLCFFNNAINFYAYMIAAQSYRKQFVSLVQCRGFWR